MFLGLCVKYMSESGEVEVPVKLFVGRFPRSLDDAELEQVFSPFGKVKECTVLRDHTTRESKGCGFVKFAHLSSAIECIKQMNGVHVLDALIGPAQVQFANGEIERLGLSTDQVEAPPVKVFVGSLPASFSAQDLEQLFMPYGPVVETFILSDGATGLSKGSGFVKMRSKQDANAAISALNKSTVVDSKPLEVRLAVSRLQRQRKFLSTTRPHVTTKSPPVVAGLAPAGSRSGPPGCNVFVFHIPPEWTELHLRQYFTNYGFLISATVIKDKETHMSRGFGFVSFDNPYSAQSAVLHMNGFMVGGKRLKVQLKRGEDDQRHFLLAGG